MTMTTMMTAATASTLLIRRQALSTLCRRRRTPCSSILIDCERTNPSLSLPSSSSSPSSFRHLSSLITTKTRNRRLSYHGTTIRQFSSDRSLSRLLTSKFQVPIANTRLGRISNKLNLQPVRIFSTETNEDPPESNNNRHNHNNHKEGRTHHERRIDFLKEYQLFNPWQYPSSSFFLLSNSNNTNSDTTNNDSTTDDVEDDDGLSSEELRLQKALQEYRTEIDRLVNAHAGAGDDDIDTNEIQMDLDSSVSPVIDPLLSSYMEMMYWEEALELERCKCHLWFHEGTDEYTDSIHAQGKLFLRQEDFKRSKELYDYALDYFSSHDDPTTQRKQQHGHVLISLAGWYFFRQELDQAIELLEQAEPLLDTNPALLVKCLDNQGLVHRLWGDFEMSLDKYQQASQVVTGGVDPDTEVALQLHIADMLQALERSDEALEVYKGLLKKLDVDDQKNTTTMNSKFGDNNRSNSDGPDLGMKGVLFHNIATIHVDQGEYDLALEEFQRAMEYKQSSAGGEYNPEVGRTLTSLGALHAGVFDDKVEALQCFNQALLIARINAADGDPQSDPDVLVAIKNINMIEQALQDEPK